MLPVLKDYISQLIKDGIDGYKEICDGVPVGNHAHMGAASP